MIVSLENEKVKVEIDTFGAFINSLFNKKENMEHAWPYIEKVWPRRTSVCFPFCGLLSGNEYEWKGRKYSSLPRHGFLRERELNIKEKRENTLTLFDSYDRETLLLYPFKYYIEIKYEIEDSTLNITYRIKNEGEETMIYSFGSHYTYSWRRENDDRIIFDKSQNLKLYSLSRGEEEDDLFLKDEDNIRIIGLAKNGSLVFKRRDNDFSSISIGRKNDTFTSILSSNFSYLLLWYPIESDAPFIAVENWDGVPDKDGESIALEEKKNLKALKKGESKTYIEKIVF